MFLTAINEKEVIEIVKESKYQKSLDCNDIDMVVIKKSYWGNLKTIYIHL